MATQTVKWYEILSDGRSVLRQTQIQDDTYGIAGKPFKTPFLLGSWNWDKSKFFTGEELLNRFRSPKWGTNKDKYFIDLIPDFPAKVSPVLFVDKWPWYEFDPNNEKTYPQSEVPPDSPYYNALDGQRGWECEDGKYLGTYYQNMHWRGQETVEEWKALRIFRYRRQKDTGENCTIPNPEYPKVEAARAEAGQKLMELCQAYLFPTALYRFQGLPLNGNGKTYMWSIDGVKMEPDPNHKLAVVMDSDTTSLWKFIRVPMRNPELVTVSTADGPVVKDYYKIVFDQKINPFMWDLTKEEKLVYLTQ